MAKKKLTPKKHVVELRKLNFLIGKWHTKGLTLQGAAGPSKEIRGMDTYEWVSGGAFILHRVDVFMGNERKEAVEIIGYDENSKNFYMTSFDDQGASITMDAFLEKSGILKFGDNNMKAVLTVGKGGNSMSAKWKLSENGKKWKPWMHIQLDK